jgi:hypothetical protein
MGILVESAPIERRFLFGEMRDPKHARGGQRNDRLAY